MKSGLAYNSPSVTLNDGDKYTIGYENKGAETLQRVLESAGATAIVQKVS